MIMIWHLKIGSFWVEVFQTNFLHLCSFCFNKSHIESLSNISNKNHNKKCIYINAHTEVHSITFNLKNWLIYSLCKYVIYLYMHVFLFKLKFLIQWKIWHLGMLMAWQCMIFYKNYNVMQKIIHLIFVSMLLMTSRYVAECERL
jgi:hypothetical protein